MMHIFSKEDVCWNMGGAIEYISPCLQCDQSCMYMIVDYGLKEKPGEKVEYKHAEPISECCELAFQNNRACV